MNVTYIHHSCFLVEVDEKVLIFDWFAGDRVNGYQFRGVLPAYEPDTPVYVTVGSAALTAALSAEPAALIASSAT